ncbi:MAG: MBL fold metallo-hydrolase [Spirochaetales bacterium]|nr:MBL fold metallo-hydrolase [Spirochaetales bacterium]
MKMLFLGTYGAVPSGASGNTSFIVSAGGEYILIDASGNPLQGMKAAGVNPDELTTLVLTHAHVDHIYALPSLVHALFCAGRKKPLTIVSNPETVIKAKGLLDFFGLNRKKIGFDIIYSTEKYKSNMGSFKIELFPGAHSVPSSMVRISESGDKAVFYTADTGSIADICGLAKGCRVMIHETSGPKSTDAKLSKDGHSSGYNAGINARCAGVKGLFLCHFSTDADAAPEAMGKEARLNYGGEIVIPEPFKWYTI